LSSTGTHARQTLVTIHAPNNDHRIRRTTIRPLTTGHTLLTRTVRILHAILKSQTQILDTRTRPTTSASRESTRLPPRSRNETAALTSEHRPPPGRGQIVGVLLRTREQRYHAGSRPSRPPAIHLHNTMAHRQPTLLARIPRQPHGQTRTTRNARSRCESSRNIRTTLPHHIRSMERKQCTNHPKVNNCPATPTPYTAHTNTSKGVHE